MRFFLPLFFKGIRIPLEYREVVEKYSAEYSLNKNFVYAVIKVESSFNPNAKSSAGAKGLMQLTDSTAEYTAKLLGLETFDLFDGETNINLGCYYLKYLSERFENLQTVICAYNAGEGRVREWLKNTEYSKDGKTLIVVPYPETNEYREKILKTFSKYEKLY